MLLPGDQLTEIKLAGEASSTEPRPHVVGTHFSAMATSLLQKTPDNDTIGNAMIHGSKTLHTQNSAPRNELFNKGGAKYTEL